MLTAIAGVLFLLSVMAGMQLWQSRRALDSQPVVLQLLEAPERIASALGRLRGGSASRSLLEGLRSDIQWFDSAVSALGDRAAVVTREGMPVALATDPVAVGQVVDAWQSSRDELLVLLPVNQPGAEILARAEGRLGTQRDALRQGLQGIAEAQRRLAAGGVSNAVYLYLPVLLAAIGLSVLLLLRMLKAQVAERAQMRHRQQQAESILGAIADGLLLIDRNYTIGEQYSEITEQIFGRQQLAGMNLFGLIQGLVTEKTVATARDYLDLLFGERVNEKLVQDLNPLDVVEFHFDNGRGGFDSKFLGFRFKRVFIGGTLSHLLVTVADITRRIQMERELREQQEKTQAQMDMLVELLHVDPDTLSGFLPRAQQMLLEVNQILKDPASDAVAYRGKLDQIFRLVHGLKGEAGAIELKSFQAGAHELEALLSEMRGRPSLGGNDFLTFTIKLEELFTQLDAVRVLLGRLAQLRQAFEAQAQSRRPGTTGEQPRPTPGALPDLLQGVAEQVAQRQGKRVRVTASGLDPGQVPPRYEAVIREILVQLVRNAVVHGIEAPRVRISRAKPEVGQVVVLLRRMDDGYELLFRDDGAGIDTAALKAAALRAGTHNREQLARMTDNEAMSLIFEPSLSTVSKVDEDAGRGVGLDLVRHRVSELDGQLRLATATGKGTQFKVLLKA